MPRTYAFVSLRLEPELLAAVDQRAKEAGVSRSAYLLHLLRQATGLPEPQNRPARSTR